MLLSVELGDSETLLSCGGNSGFLSSFSAGTRVTLEPCWEMQCAYQIAVWLPVELSRVDSTIAGMCKMAPVLWQCVGG